MCDMKKPCKSVLVQTVKRQPAKRSAKRYFQLHHSHHSTPAKRIRLSPIHAPSSDSTFSPSNFIGDSTVSTDSSMCNEEGKSPGYAYLIVSKKRLDDLLRKCLHCSRQCSLKWHFVGTMYKASMICPKCQSGHEWQSQDDHRKSSVGNLKISAAIYFSGNNFRKIEKLFHSMKMKFLSNGCYYKIVKEYLQPTVFHFYNQRQLEEFQVIKSDNRELILSGDMRADSPGHCAKYGSYSLLDSQTNKVLHFELIQSNEVGGSNYMEKEGLIRCLTRLAHDELFVKQLVTDRHPVIQKLLRDFYPSINHKFDVWHIAKGLTKKLVSLSLKKEHKDIVPWVKSISNHLYWTATSSISADESIAKWTSLSNHICNIHDHANEVFPKCLHDDLSEDDHSKAWIEPNSPSDEKLSKIVHDKRLLTSVKKMSSSHQTSALESFHASLLQYVPKNTVFSYKGMLSRLMLAVLSFNENSDRNILIDPETQKPKLKTRYPKRKKGQFSFSLRKEKASSAFIEDLIIMLVDDVCHDPLKYQLAFLSVPVPPPLNDKMVKPTSSDKEMAVRFLS